jgi:hypothetical protein
MVAEARVVTQATALTQELLERQTQVVEVEEKLVEIIWFTLVAQEAQE